MSMWGVVVGFIIFRVRLRAWFAWTASRGPDVSFCWVCLVNRVDLCVSLTLPLRVRCDFLCACFSCASTFWFRFCYRYLRASSVPPCFCFCFCFAFFIELVEFVQVLICKDWCAFGHRFATRSGHGRDPGGETSPIFPQFLDATYQLLRQFPTSFEFSENLLILLLHAYHSRWDPRLLVRCFRVFGTTLRHVEGCHGVTPLVTAYHGVRFGILRHATSQYGSSPHV